MPGKAVGGGKKAVGKEQKKRELKGKISRIKFSMIGTKELADSGNANAVIALKLDKKELKKLEEELNKLEG